MSLSPGTRLGPYEIIAAVGAGGMGEVYRARDTRLNRSVAIKVSKETFSERFEGEARAIATLNHPNICQLFDVGPNYIVMEFVEGTPVAAVDSPKRLLDVAIQIADGLAAAHAAGIVHRDLKPENILVTRDGRVKVLDFGLAKQSGALEAAAAAVTRATALTDPGSTIGTVAYMSPEQARGEANLTAQSDQFSVGIVLYELATGRRPFQRGSTAETMTAIIREDPEPLPPTIPAPIRWVIERLLSKEPADRYDSTRDLFRELRQIRDRLSQTTSAVEPSARAASSRPRRMLAIVLTTAVVCLAAGAIASLLLLPAPGPDISSYSFTPLSRQDATERWPVWSPDGNSIAFLTSVHGILQVFTKSIDRTDAAQLTRSTSDCGIPFWAPDGSTIYYVSRGSLWAVPASGGTPELVLDKTGNATIHPDGTTLAFVRGGKLWVTSLKKEAPREFGISPFPPSEVSAARFSPDGSKLMTAAANDTWILPFPSGTPWKVKDLSAVLPGGAAWLPDNRHVVAPGPTSGASTWTLWRVDTRDGSRERIYASAESIIGASISPDGKRLAYQTGQIEWNVLEISLPSGAVHTAMSGSGIVSWWPDWAPSGTHYMVSTNRSGASAIEDVSAADGFSRRLAAPSDPEGFVSTPRWAPDGSRFTFLSVDLGSGSGPRLMVANASGSNATTLEENASFRNPTIRPSWSPDSQWIAYARPGGARMQVVKMRPGSSSSPQLLTEFAPGNWTNYPVVEWSPKGEWIAYPTQEGLALTSPDGKNTRKLTDRKLQVYGFSKNGETLFGILRDTSGEGPQWQLYSVDVKTGTDTFLATVDLPASADSIAGFSLHPDGKRFLTSIAKWPFDIWMMEGFDTPTSWWERLVRRR